MKAVDTTMLKYTEQEMVNFSEKKFEAPKAKGLKEMNYLKYKTKAISENTELEFENQFNMYCFLPKAHIVFICYNPRKF